MMHLRIFMDFTEFLTVICDVISTPSPFQKIMLYMHCAFRFHCKRVTITSQGMFEVPLCKENKEFIPVFQVIPVYVRCTVHAPMVYYMSTEYCA